MAIQCQYDLRQTMFDVKICAYSMDWVSRKSCLSFDISAVNV